MLLGIDHLVIACADPDAAVAVLEREMGLGPGGGGRHDALGTFNRLVWLGDSYLELIGIFDRDLAERSWIGAPSVRAIDAGGGLATWSVATDDIDGDVARVNAGGAVLAGPIAGERRRPDGAIVRWRLSVPRELGPERPPFLIEHDPAAAEWSSDERARRAAEVHPLGAPVRLEMLELGIADVPGMIGALMRSARIGPFRPSLAGGGARDAAIGGQTLRLRPVRPVGTTNAWPVATIHLRAEPAIAGKAGPSASSAPSIGPRSVVLLGCRFVVRRQAQDGSSP